MIIMKKISLLLIILLSTLCSCKSKVNIYNEENINDYLNEVYNIINDEDIKYVAYDLRSKTDYETLHIRQFQNYDINKGSNDTFIKWLTSNYSKKHYIILYSEESINEELITEIKNNYKHIYIATSKFQDIKNDLSELFTLDSGEYDCGC